MKKGKEQLELELQKLQAQMGILRDIASKLTEERDLKLLARYILEGAKRLIPFTDGAIGLVDEGYINFPYAIGEYAESVMNFRIKTGDGLTGWVVENKQLVNVKNTEKDERYHGQIKTTKSELDVPIFYNGESLGVINIESSSKNAFSADDELLLTALAEYAAIAINNARIFNELQALREIDALLASTLDSTEILDLILRTAANLIKCPEVSVGIVNKETNKIYFTLAKGAFSEDVQNYVGSVESGLTGAAVRERKPFRVGDVTKDPIYDAQINDTRSELDVPMLLGEEAIGVLNAESPYLNAFTKHDEELLVALASQAALAVRNSEEYQKINDDLIAAETMAAIGDVAGSMVHRMNNDVGAIRIFAQQITGVILDKVSPNDNDAAKDLIESAKEIEELAEKVLSDVRAFREQFKEAEPSLVDVNQILLSSLEEIQKQIPSGIILSKELVEGLSQSWASDIHLKEVFRNLITNAIQAMPHGGELLIKSHQVEDKIKIHVKDTGIGISDKNRPFIFNRGFTTKKEGQQGLGYGLWWVKTYLRRNKGDLELEETKPGVGSTFVITLPIIKN